MKKHFVCIVFILFVNLKISAQLQTTLDKPKLSNFIRDHFDGSYEELKAISQEYHNLYLVINTNDAGNFDSCYFANTDSIYKSFESNFLKSFRTKAISFSFIKCRGKIIVPLIVLSLTFKAVVRPQLFSKAVYDLEKGFDAIYLPPVLMEISIEK